MTMTWFRRGLSEIRMASNFKQNLHKMFICISNWVKLNTINSTQTNIFQWVLTEKYVLFADGGDFDQIATLESINLNPQGFRAAIAISLSTPS